ncbi:MAG: type IV pili methyl-accepting chemotaxis transducer N-terminal domain-containing protein [Burkholderiaceae bacterium]
MNRRKFLIVGAAATGSLLSMGNPFAQVININDAINKSGRQRMLSQRLAKCYFQIGQSIDTEHSKAILDASLALFDRQLVELKVFAPTQDNKAVLGNLEKAWISYKDVLVGRAPNKQDAKSILAINEDVLAMAQASTVQLEKFSGTTTGKLVNIAGRQRMLSQRMAKFYQAENWGVASPDTMDKLLAARKEFVDALNILATAPNNTQDIRDEIELGKTQWVFFDNALSNSVSKTGNKKVMATNVATTSERILEVMDKVTGLYAKLA